jgi:hypothetical protein
MSRLEPELLPDGAILAPITQENGQQTTVRLEPGEEEHAAWLAYIQRHRAGAPPPPPPPPSSDLFYDPTKAPPLASAPSTTLQIPWRPLLLGLVGILAVIWFTGALDKQLVGIGLNKNPCVVTALAGTLCGNEAKAWCDSTDGLRRLAPGQSSDAQATCDDIRGQ